MAQGKGLHEVCFAGTVYNRHYEKIGSEVKDITNEIDLECPRNWTFVRLRDLIELISGRDLLPTQYNSDKIGMPYITGASNLLNERIIINRWTDTPSVVSHKGDLLITCKGTIGEMVFNNIGDVHIARQIMSIRCIGVNSLFIMLVLNSYVSQLQSGAKSFIPGISRDDILKLPFIMPPLEEQTRIVNRVEELFAQIDIINQNQADIDTLYDEFRKRTLTLAIQGKLVPQNPNDEPASVLLECIRAEKKAKLGKKYVDSFIYKGDDNCYYEKVGETVTNINDEIPFDLPENWAWIRLGYIIDFSKSDTVAANQINPLSWVLDLEDIEKDSGRLLQKKAMSETQSKSDKHSFCKGNVLYSKLRPYLNKVIVADDNGYCTTEILAFDFGQHIAAQYAQIYLMSPYFVDYAMAGSYGVKMPRIGSVRGNAALMPLPPYNEQMRIIQQYTAIKMSIKDKD